MFRSCAPFLPVGVSLFTITLAAEPRPATAGEKLRVKNSNPPSELDIRGRLIADSLISSSCYISGYFDEDTINTYFNEYTQPAGAAIVSEPRPGRQGWRRRGQG